MLSDTNKLLAIVNGDPFFTTDDKVAIVEHLHHIDRNVAHEAIALIGIRGTTEFKIVVVVHL